MLNVPRLKDCGRPTPSSTSRLNDWRARHSVPIDWSLDDQVTDGSNYARVVSGALTEGAGGPHQIRRSDERQRATDMVWHVYLSLDYLEHYLELVRAEHLSCRRLNHADS